MGYEKFVVISRPAVIMWPIKASIGTVIKAIITKAYTNYT